MLFGRIRPVINVEAEVISDLPKERLITFDNLDIGTVSRRTFNELGIPLDNWDNNLTQHVTIESDINGNNYLSIFTPKGTYGTKDSGAQFEIELYPSTFYYSSYDIMFDKNYSWGGTSKGGKLPGLTAGGRCAAECDGTDGFATRYMWRREGEGELYLCNLDKESAENCDD